MSALHALWLPTLLALALASCGSEPLGSNAQEARTAPVIADLTAAPLSAPAMAIFGDTNRDGALDDQDRAGRETWSWQTGGAFFIANLDDDDLDGIADCDDGFVNTGGDTADQALIQITLGGHAATSVKVTVASGPEGFVNLSERTYGIGNGWRRFLSGGLLTQVKPQMLVGVEGKHFPGREGWDGFVSLKADLLNASGNVLASDTVRLRVAPWMMLSNAAPTEQVYIASGRYPRATRLADGLAAVTEAPVVEYSTGVWQEMWMQDTMEIGYTEIPGTNSRMHVALRASRCGNGSCDRFAATLLAKNVGRYVVPVTGATGAGNWDDWFGNLEVSPATPTWPLGRIYFGVNLNAGWKAFLRAQEVQRPFEIDPTWLLIKHIDEVMNFVPGPDGRPRLLVVSPREAHAAMGGTFNLYNQGIEAKVQESVAVARAALGLAEDQIVLLPLSFAAGGVGKWSNPVNSLHLNGTVAAGNTVGDNGENQLEVTAQGQRIAQKILGLGLQMAWVNDVAYQANRGNVHCATNARRTPPTTRFWETLPALP